MMTEVFHSYVISMKDVVRMMEIMYKRNEGSDVGCGNALHSIAKKEMKPNPFYYAVGT